MTMKKKKINKIELKLKNCKVITKESSKAKDLYDFIKEHASDLLAYDEKDLSDYTADAFKYIKANKSRLYSKYKDDIDGIIAIDEVMYYEYISDNFDYLNKVSLMLADNIDDLLNDCDDLANAVMNYLALAFDKVKYNTKIKYNTKVK